MPETCSKTRTGSRSSTAIAPVRDWLDEVKPDVAVVIYNDHGLNFFLDKQPTFAIGAAPEYRNDDEGWGIPTIAPFKGDPAFSWHLIDNLVHDDFDLVTCQEMLVDHGFTVPMQLFWPNYDEIGIKTVPLVINTVQHPLPSPRRCYNLGKSLGKAIESYPEDLKVVILGTGGLSHQLDGERAGFINPEFDRTCMEKIVDDPEHFLDMSIRDLRRGGRCAGSRVHPVAGHARRADRQGYGPSQQLPHPDLQHGVRPSVAWKTPPDRG